MQPERLEDREIASLLAKKIFFGHKSVGADILEGVRDLMSEDPRLKLRIVASAAPESIPGPALIEAALGENGDPASKNRAFSAILERGMGAQGGIAAFKYCYADFHGASDPKAVFDEYRRSVSTLQRRYPLLRIVHITCPLTTADNTPGERIKAWLGRVTASDLNARRNEFNRLLKTYAGAGPVFDLAEVESTRSDGLRSYFRRGGQPVYTLAPEFTNDGGHLNQAGRRAAARRFLSVLANL
jgi:hypothetical protein